MVVKGLVEKYSIEKDRLKTFRLVWLHLLHQTPQRKEERKVELVEQ